MIYATVSGAQSFAVVARTDHSFYAVVAFLRLLATVAMPWRRFAAVATPWRTYAEVAAPMIPVTADGLLYNRNTGEYLYNSVTGEMLKW